MDLNYGHHTISGVRPLSPLLQLSSVTILTLHEHSPPIPLQATLSNPDTQSFITSDWDLSKSHTQSGASNFAFVNDPFPTLPAPGSSSNTGGLVAQVQYLAGGYENGDNDGAQLLRVVECERKRVSRACQCCSRTGSRLI